MGDIATAINLAFADNDSNGNPVDVVKANVRAAGVVIDNDVLALQRAVANETQSRQSGDATSLSAVSAETTRAASAEGALGALIGSKAANSDLTALATLVNDKADASATATNLFNEATSRAQGDAANTAALQAETQARLGYQDSETSARAQAISDEQRARAGGDASNVSALAQEVARAEAEEVILQTQVTAAQARADGAVIIANTKAAQTDLVAEIVRAEQVEQAFSAALGTKAGQAALDALTASIGAKAAQSAVDALNSALAGEIARAEAAESGLTSTIGTKAGQVALDAMTNALNAEVARAQASEASLGSAVGAKAAQAALDALATIISKKAALSDLVALSSVVDTKAAQVDLAALTSTVSIVALRASALYPSERPGDGAFFFTPSIDSLDPSAYPPIAPSTLNTNSEGRVVRLAGEGYVVTREFFAMEPGRVYGVRNAFSRSANPADPSGDTIRFGLFCYDANKTPVATLVLEDYPSVMVASGLFGSQHLVTRNPVGPGDVPIPVSPSTRYARPFIQTFGGNQATDVSVIRWIDATDAVIYSPATDGLAAELAVEISRAEAAEGAVAQSVASEAARAKAAEAAVAGNVTSEISRAEAVENVLASSVASETIRAEAAESFLASNVTSEISRAEAAEMAVASSVANEVTRAEAAESVITGSVASEINRAEAVEAVLSKSVVDAEAASPDLVDPTGFAVLDPSGRPLMEISDDGRFVAEMYDPTNPAPATVDGRFARAVTDASGAPIAGVGYDGRYFIADLDDRSAPATVDGRFAYVLRDARGGTMIGIGPDGRLYGNLADNPVPFLVDAHFCHAISDPSGFVLGGFDWLGRLVANSGPPRFSTYQTGAIGARRCTVFSEVIGEVDISGGEFADVVSCQGGGTYAYYFGRPAGGGVPVRREAYLTPACSLSSSVTSLVGLIVHGQSLAVGNSAIDLINPVPLNPGRAVMFNGGVRPGGGDFGPLYHIDPLDLRDVVDLHESQKIYTTETVASEAASFFLAGQPASVGMISTNVGVGSQQYVFLKKGTPPFDNLVTCVLRMMQVARLTGRTLSQVCFFWRQGESDGGLSEAQYTADLLELQNDVSTAVQSITGQAMNVVLITDQVSVILDLLYSGPTLAQFNAALANPTNIACIGPKYWCQYSDGLHIRGLYQALTGAILGRALRSIVAGTVPLPLCFASAVRTGTTVILTAQGGSGTQLVIDTVRVSDPGGAQPYGISYRDSNDNLQNTATVTAVAVQGTNQLKLTLSNVPTGSSPLITIAATTSVQGNNGGPITGARSCIRDSAPETVTIAGTVYPLFNWACHQKIPLTTSG